ncbi:hypothetical protein F5X68DRAFT_51268 [Plectosphaerella plurivora]|uniref:Uncharacterized protein n=1 Tax=Plectosphaerella plurivora TaxID=936078 RepID=A0A9P9A672_9PEZI|nr:hypothetical protein F5X68DRAFT_51268 [Plectosphaerella plurivora]
MSVSPSGSPPPGPVSVDEEAPLPQGQCRYILLIPGIKGERCGCAHFSLSQATPGAGCDCGHMACYHVQEPESITERRELDLLKQRVHSLEQQLTHQQHVGSVSVVARLSELEELLDKSRNEMGQEMRGTYRNITRVWQSVEQLEQRHTRLYEVFRSQSDHLARLGRDVREMGNRQLELFDADISLEERIDRIEGLEDDKQLSDSEQPLPPTPDITPPIAAEPSSSHPSRHTALSLVPPPSPPLHTPVRPESSMTQRSGGPWTVHISLLPTSSQPFPFERDTNAYKRCLSRGLHQTVVVADSTGAAFDEAVRKSFHHILRGRPWMPLKAKLCDFNQLKGLPMLRMLEASLLEGPYDMKFLLRHCAVCDSHGNIESLYLAMRQDTLSWPFLRSSPVVIDGLETCWEFDQYLDPTVPFSELDDRDSSPRPPGVEIRSALVSLKRAANEDYEDDSGNRSKIQRVRYTDVKKGIETM